MLLRRGPRRSKKAPRFLGDVAKPIEAPGFADDIEEIAKLSRRGITPATDAAGARPNGATG